MFIIIMKNITNNKMYTVQELHIFQDHSKDHYKSFHFHYSYNFHNLNILQRHVIHHINNC